MKVLELLPIGNLDTELLVDLVPALSTSLHVPCEVVSGRMDPAFAFHRERHQYHSSEILLAMQDIVTPNTWRVLGIAAADLYIPILTFVFGEAQMGGPLRGRFDSSPSARILWTSRKPGLAASAPAKRGVARSGAHPRSRAL